MLASLCACCDLLYCCNNREKESSHDNPPISAYCKTYSPSKMASLQRHRSPCRSGELVTMCEHQGSSSPERSWSDDETSSNSTLNDVDEADERLSLSHTVNHDPTCLSSSVLFPFHLIAGCSSAERRTMCNLSGTLTSQEDRRVVEVKGTSTWAMHLAPQPAPFG